MKGFEPETLHPREKNVDLIKIYNVYTKHFSIR
jgi:hypothetical protein